MGQSGVSTGFAKCFILFMAIVILLQGAVYLGLSIWGFTLRTCSGTKNIQDQPFQFAMESIYFTDKNCGYPRVEVDIESDLVSESPIELEKTLIIDVDWDRSERITHREYALMISYAVISALWIVTSLLIIMTICGSTTKLISALCYWPWFIFIILGSILDVVATVYHAIDVTETGSYESTFDYIGFSLPDSEIKDQITETLKTFDSYFVTPAVVMTIISTRIVLIWLLNLFGASFCLSLSRILPKQTAVAVKNTREEQPPAAAAIAQPPPRPQLQLQQSQQYQAPQYTEQYPEQIRPKPLPIIVPAGTDNGQRQEPYNYLAPDRTTLQSPVAILPPPTAPPQENRQSLYAQQSVPNDNSYRTTEAHPDRLNYPVQPATPEQRASPSPQLAVTSPLNNRYADSFAYPSQQPNQRVSQELRSQLPWSYTSMPGKPQPPPPPRKPQVTIYPQIPEPDYAEQ